MLIRVVYRGGETGMVSASELDQLIDNDEIAAFCRADGWVRIGADPVRTRQLPFAGMGKRWTDITPQHNSPRGGPIWN